MKPIYWTERARRDLDAHRAFIGQDSPRYAEVVISRLINAAERLARSPESGRIVPEFGDPLIREVISRPYRIVYQLAGDSVHILTVHHGSRRFPTSL